MRAVRVSSRSVVLMGDVMDAKNLADLYGLPLIDWARVEARLGVGIH